MLKKVKTTIATVAALAFSATPVFAQIEDPTRFENICDVVGVVTSFIIGIAGAIALVLLIIGGIQYMISGGDKVAVESARGRITASIVGLLIVFGAFLIVNVVGGLISDNFVLCQV